MHVPEGWKLLPIRDLCSCIIDCVNKTAPVVDYETPFKMIRTTNVRNGRVDTKNVRYVTEETYINWTRRGKPQSGDLIFTREAPVGEVGILDNAEGIFLGQRTVMYRAHPNKSNNLYILYSLQSDFCQKQIEDFSNGGTVFHVRVPDCSEILIRSAPLSEQQKVAQIISAWDKAIEKLEALIAAKQKRKKALMQQLLTGKKRFAGFEEEWKSTRLMKLLKEEKTRNKDCSITRVLSVTNHSGFVLPEEQFSRQVASSDLSNYKIVRRGQFGYNPSRINVGSFARLDSYEVGVLSPMYVVFSIDERKLNSDFFLNWMSSHEARQRIISSTQGSVRDSVGFDALSSFHIKLPAIDEQKKIAAVFTAADSEIETHQKQLAALKEQKKGLMQQLLTGKKRVNIEKEA